MNLYLMRHAEAVPVGANNGGTIIRDADRPLSASGETVAALMGKALARLDSTVRVVMTSPLLRAVQTGNIVGREIGGQATMKTTTNLNPGFTSEKLVEEILALSNGGNIVAIGHQPDLSMCISYLIAGSGSATIAMEPGAIACVKITPRGRRAESQLRWLLTPDIAASMNSQP